ncbi:hypothetical protein TNCV_657361 [Trichonephila clavipes]|nr:hypothetical protein TNCV_657361 [Trichonephila clavipes]
MLQHQGEDPMGKPGHPLSVALTLQQCLFGETEERYHQPINRSELTPASRLQRSVGQRCGENSLKLFGILGVLEDSLLDVVAAVPGEGTDD